ncbi:DUF928 domain-containing protein [Synechocystis salina]|uniref:DUF928 domain-containing protein n=1 Tax=Synechocystis salina LEGE 00031 TaxID=1828736 RepID=A0ABR9VU12_9SYNC|nr:DUF928 domain-containing protein [Synechocystis salina]MBE9240928.1 DUF928 domain-containing protein [Synechocystis salina LEGE 00041]MBE9254388.1 DUF928 domain-containing protein [Synechocystis salina LEGE 00031]
MVNHPFHLFLASALTFTVTAPQTIASGVDDLSFGLTPEETLVSLKFPQAGDRGTTQSSGGGGTRGGSCFTQANTNLRIVAPSQDTFTATANPSLFVYVPANRGVEGEFVLVDGAGELIHSQTVAVPEGETILAIAVPTDVALEPGGEYAWAFAVNCTIDNQVVGSAVEAGLVHRELSVEVTEEIEETNEPLGKATLYANQGIWQDTLMIVASLPEQREELVELLGSVGLDQFSDVPIIFVGTDEAGDVPLAN